MGDLPVVARRWRQLHAKLSRLRGLLNRHPKNHPRWDHWYSQAEQLLELRQQLIQPMRDSGFRVHKRSAGTPLSSFRELQRERFLEQEQKFAATDAASWDDIYAAWDAVYAGIDSDSLPRVKQHNPDTSHCTNQ